MENKEISEFKQKSVLVICWAGSDRSKLIADELSFRGYFSSHRGVMGGHNYVTPNDLLDVGTVVFASIKEKGKFDKYPKLKQLIHKNEIRELVLNITESDKDHAFGGGDMEKLKSDIRLNLDSVGLRKIEDR